MRVITRVLAVATVVRFVGAAPAAAPILPILDHIGWQTPNLAAKTTELKKKGVTFTTEPRPLKLASGTS